MKKALMVPCLSVAAAAGVVLTMSAYRLLAADSVRTPHGGTPVLVADHRFHLELVRDGDAGLMQAYVRDDQLRKSVSVKETNFLLQATFAGRTEKVEFQRAPGTPGGTLPESSPLFEARASWIKDATNFAGVIPTITLNGRTFTNIRFPFPKGTHHVH